MAGRIPKMEQADLARATGLSTSAVSRFLKDTPDEGRKGSMKFEDLADIAMALGLTPVQLLERAERLRSDAAAVESAEVS